MRILIGSDFHINEHKRLDDQIDALNQIVKIAQTVKPYQFVCLGDVFDKNRPTPREMQVLNKWLLAMKKHVGKITLLEGNHDKDRNISSLSYLTDLEVPGVTVMNPPCFICDGKLNMLFYLGHEQINGALADNGIKLSGGSSLDSIIRDFPKCRVFAFGHFHKPQILREKPLAFYAGSIYNKTFGEQNDEKKLWLFENEKLVKTKLVKTIELKTRQMIQYDLSVYENIDDPQLAPWHGAEEKDKLKGALVKIVYSGTKVALKEVNENSLREMFFNEFKVRDLTVMYTVLDKSQARNKNINEAVTEKVALEEYFKNKDIEHKEEVVERGLELIKESR